MRKPKIILDCDDVLFNTNEIALEHQNKKYGSNYTIEDLSTWGLTGNEILDERLKLFSDPDFVKNQPLYPGAWEFVEELCSFADVSFATAVPPQCMSARAERIIKEFDVPAEKVIIASDKSLLQADYLLDDSAKNIENSSAKHPVLFRRPWNYSISGITSVSKYDDFICFVRYVEGRTPFKGIDKDRALICLVGPSGSGKTEIAVDAYKQFGFRRPKTTTTRKRENNKNFFYEVVSKEEFLAEANRGEFIETTVYGGEFYGIKKKTISEFFERGQTAIIPLDMCGAMAMKNLYPERTAIVFVEKNKNILVSNILSKNMPHEEKVLRLLNLDTEIANKQFCDFSITSANELIHAF